MDLLNYEGSHGITLFTYYSDNIYLFEIFKKSLITPMGKVYVFHNVGPSSKGLEV